MKSTKTLRWLLGITILVALIGSGLLSWYDQEPQSATPRTIRYRALVKNSQNTALPQEKIKLFAPRHSGSAQIVESINANEPFQTITDPTGNSTLLFDLFLPPFGTKEIIVDVQLKLRPQPSAGLDDAAQYRAAERFIELEDPGIQARAAQLVNDGPANSAVHNAYQWVAKNLESEGFSPSHFGARHALEKRRGDCTEFSFLLVALLRAQGISARVVSGFIVTENTVIAPGRYHNWVEYYEGGRWRIADPFNKVFDAGYDQYITFQTLGTAPANTAGLPGGQRFEAASPQVEVVLK